MDDDDFVQHLLAQEASLVARLDAVRATLAVFKPTSTPLKTDRLSRVLERFDPAAPAMLRTDKFSLYGQSVVAGVLKAVPAYGAPPVPTRVLVEQLEASGVHVRGKDKVNALSALLARSSQLKAHGRRGWTRAENTPPSAEAPGGNESSAKGDQTAAETANQSDG